MKEEKTAGRIRNVLSKYAYKIKIFAASVCSFFASQQMGAVQNGGSRIPEQQKTKTVQTPSPFSEVLPPAVCNSDELSMDGIKTGGVYNGKQIEFSDFRDAELGYLFESGMNPYITDPSGQYLGLCQMDVGSTMQAFLFGTKTKHFSYEGIAKKYPELAALGKTEAMRKQKKFIRMFGDLSKTKEFCMEMEHFMDICKYQPVYEALRQIPDLEFDKRSKVFIGTVKSAANQNPTPSVIAKLYREAVMQAKLKAAKENKPLDEADIIAFSYKARQQRWGLAQRYKEENRLAQDWYKYVDRVRKIELARAERAEKMLKLTDKIELAQGISSLSSPPDSSILSPLQKKNTNVTKTMRPRRSKDNDARGM